MAAIDILITVFAAAGAALLLGSFVALAMFALVAVLREDEEDERGSD